MGHSACLLKQFRLLENYEILVIFNRNSLICQTTAKYFFDYFGVILRLFSNVKLQFTCKKPTEQRIRSLLRVSLLPTMETSQKIWNFAQETLNLDVLYRLISATFEVILMLNTAILFKIAYCIASFIVFSVLNILGHRNFQKLNTNIRKNDKLEKFMM